jgi:HlyD family secretion protein
MITQKPSEPDVTLADSEVEPEFAEPIARPARKRWWVIPAGLIILIAAAWGIARLVSGNANAAHYLTAPAAYANISASVEETGTVNPVNEVAVGTQVSGTISSLNVDFNSLVKKGEVLATLDQTPFKASAIQAHGAVAAAQSNASAASSSAQQSAASEQNAIAVSRQATANAQSASANVGKAQAQLTLSQATVARDRSLLSQGFIAQSQLDTDVAAEKANEADVLAARSALAAAQAQVNAANSQIAGAGYQHQANVYQAQAAASQAEAGQGQVQQADYNLANAVIRSPIDGIVVSRNISVGQTVAASFSTPTLFVIASSLKDMQVDTSVSEADVGQLKPGALARIVVPAYPNTVFNGTVTQVRVNPTNVQNVVTYDVIVSVHDSTSRLKPGMTADVTIAIQTKQHVLAIPAAALLFKPVGVPGASGRSGGGSGGGQASPTGGAPGGSTNGATNGAGAAGPAGGGSSSTSAGQVAGAPGSRAVVYVLRAGELVRVPIVIGLSDGRNYEVQRGKLAAGDLVIIGQLQSAQYNNANPMAGGSGFGR